MTDNQNLRERYAEAIYRGVTTGWVYDSAVERSLAMWDPRPTADAVLAVRDDVLAEKDAEIEELESGVRQLAKWRAEWANRAGRGLVRGDRLEAMLDRLAGQSDDNLARVQRAEAEIERLRGVDLPGHIRMENRVLWERAEAAEAEVERLRAEVEQTERDWRQASNKADHWHAQFEQLRARLAAVEALHHPSHTEFGPDFCETCSDARGEWVQWPCPTGEALTAPIRPLPEWLSDVERLAANIYYTTGVDGLRWSLLSGEAQDRFREMARKIVKYLPLASMPAVDAGDREPVCPSCGSKGAPRQSSGDGSYCPAPFHTDREPVGHNHMTRDVRPYACPACAGDREPASEVQP